MRKLGGVQMRKRDRIRHKRQSLEKWEWIVANLEKKIPKKIRPLSHSSCGYCRIYYNDYDDACNNDCALNTHALCEDGCGVAIGDIGQHNEFDKKQCQKEALHSARAFLRAIRADLLKEGSRKTKGKPR